MERCSIRPVVHDGNNGVKRKKFLGEMTTTLYWLVSSFLIREIEPQPVPETRSIEPINMHDEWY